MINKELIIKGLKVELMGNISANIVGGTKEEIDWISNYLFEEGFLKNDALISFDCYENN